MTIPETQLETWSHQGATTTAANTHQSIRNALDRYNGWPAGISYEVYLQGSYRNHTNIRGDSDVDVVVQLNSAFIPDIASLPPYDKIRFGLNHAPPAAYGWAEFRQDVLDALRRYYGSDAVQAGRKSIKLLRTSSHLPADVVVCIQHRSYTRYRYTGDIQYVDGMALWVSDERRWAVNYPKLHYDNGVSKNGTANGRFKPIVRVVKNARTYMEERHQISQSLAPSYFVECLLYNVPDACFGWTYQQIFCDIVNWLRVADLSGFLCQNRQYYLFGNSPEQWSQNNAKKFIGELVNLWNGWA